MRSKPSTSSSRRQKTTENIRVCLRLRPINKLEESRRSRHCVQVHPEQTSLTVDSPLEGEFDFSFDKIFNETASQQVVYDFVGSDVAQDLLDGKNCAVVAYGQTGTGKTHTMMGVGGSAASASVMGDREGGVDYSSEDDYGYQQGGGKRSQQYMDGDEGKYSAGQMDDEYDRENLYNDNDPDEESESIPHGHVRQHHDYYGEEEEDEDEEGMLEDDEDDETSGMIPRIVRDLFQKMSEAPASVEYVVRCSYMEIYLEKIFDLLDPSSRSLNIVDASNLISLQPFLRSEISENADGSSNEIHEEKKRQASENDGEGDDDEEPVQSPNTSLVPLIPSEGIYIQGVSEACCFDEADVVALLVRGNACRTVSSTRMNTDSSRSHAIFIVTLEQKDNETGFTKYSRLHLVDLAGSEMAGKTKKKGGVGGGGMGMMGGIGGMGNVVSAGGPLANAVQAESMIINRSLSSLGSVVKSLSETQVGGRSRRQKEQNLNRASEKESTIPYKASKLTRVLKDAFGGNCRTTLILTASPSSYNISETINTIRFGQRARRVQNIPKVNKEKGVFEYKHMLQNSEKKELEVRKYLKKLVLEDAEIKSVVGKVQPKMLEQVEKVISKHEKEEKESSEKNTQQSKDKGSSSSSRSRRGGGSSSRSKQQQNQESRDDNDNIEEKLSAAQAELEALKREMKLLTETRDQAESQVSELQSELAVLRTQNETLNQEKKKDIQDLIDAKNEVQLLLSQKLELEHDYRTSQFRENEAVIFLRQFRKFYRRLLRNKASQGSGDTMEVINDVPGAPELHDLIDIDIVLYESGLIEEEEMHDDSSVATFRPSQDAIARSSAAANHDKAGGADDGGKNDDNASRNDGYEGTIVSEITMEDAIKPHPSMNLPPSRSMLARSASGRYDGGSIRAESTGLDTISELGDGGVSMIMNNISRSYEPNVIEETPEDAYDPGAYDPNAHIRGDLGGAGGGGGGGGGGSRFNMNSLTSSEQRRMNGGEREKEMQIELHRITDKCVQLQIALNDAQANVELLTKSGNMNQKKLAQEAMTMRQALDRKSHDLQAIIWKMNELHLINKTYNEKMANRDQHVHYLEECLMDLQNTNRNLVMDKQESEAKLREELENLQVLVDAMTIPLWQFGECGVTKRNLASRIVLPIRGGHPQQLIQHDDWDDMSQLKDARRSSSIVGYDDEGSQPLSLDDSTCELTQEMSDVLSSNNTSQSPMTKETETHLQRKELEFEKKEKEIEERVIFLQKKENELNNKELAIEKREKSGGSSSGSRLGRREKELAEMEDQIFEKEKEIEEKIHEFTSWEKELSEAEAELRRRELDCAEREKEVQNEMSKLEMKEDDLNMKEAEVGLKLKDLERSFSDIHNNDSLAKDHDAKKSELLERERQLKRKEKELERRENEFQSYEEMNENDTSRKEVEMFQQIEEMEQLLRSKEKEVSFKSSQLEEKEKEVNERLKETRILLDETASYKQSYENNIAGRQDINTNEVLMELINKEIELLNKEEVIKKKEVELIEKDVALSKREKEVESLEAEIKWREEELEAKKNSSGEISRKWHNENQAEELRQRGSRVYAIEDALRGLEDGFLPQGDQNNEVSKTWGWDDEESVKQVLEEKEREIERLQRQLAVRNDVSVEERLETLRKSGKKISIDDVMRMEVELMMREEEMEIREEELIKKQDELNHKKAALRMQEEEKGFDEEQKKEANKNARKSSILSASQDINLVQKEVDFRRREEAIQRKEDEIQWESDDLRRREDDVNKKEEEIVKFEQELGAREEELDKRQEELDLFQNELEDLKETTSNSSGQFNRKISLVTQKRDNLLGKIDEVKQNKDTEILEKLKNLKIKEEELNEKEEDLQQREEDISEQIEVIQYKEDELREKESKLVLAEEQLNEEMQNLRELQEVEELLQANQRELDEKNNKIKKLNDDLAEKEREIDSLSAELEVLNADVLVSHKTGNDLKLMELEILKKEKENSKLRNQVEQLNDLVSEQEREIDNLRDKLEVVQGESVAQLRAIERHESSLVKLESSIKEKDDSLSTFEADLKQKEKVIRDLENTLDRNEKEILSLRKKLDEMEKHSGNIQMAEAAIIPLEVTFELDSVAGGWPTSYKPRRLNHKYVKNIKAGVVKAVSPNSTQVRTSKLKAATKMLMFSKMKGVS